MELGFLISTQKLLLRCQLRKGILRYLWSIGIFKISLKRVCDQNFKLSVEELVSVPLIRDLLYKSNRPQPCKIMS